MTTGRLTRQELGWLLAQEARGAAKILRQDVTLLSQPPPAPVEATPMGGPDIRVTSTLNALDDAIDMLAELETGPLGSKTSRRGRIDVAALLCELAPHANVAMEPGAGTEVFADESDLRRMLHVLLSQTNFAGGGQDATGSAVRIRREDAFVRVTAELGPDVSASTDMERRWLGRMATRLGGQLDLEGGTLSVLLPADASNDRSEVADLRKELEEAQQLGEAYARELAAVFASAEPAEVEATRDPPDVASRRMDLLVGLASALDHALRPVFRGLREEAERHAATGSITLHVSAGYELVGELHRVAACPRNEPPELADVAAILRETAGQTEARAARHGVALTVDAPPDLTLRTRPKTLALMLRALLDHAIGATPRGGAVAMVVAREGDGAVVAVRDGGAAVPSTAQEGLLEHRVDPASLGRPPGIALLLAHAAAGALGAALKLRDAPAAAAGAPSTTGAVVEARLRSL